MTRNGKVDKRALASLAQEQKGTKKPKEEMITPRESSSSPAPSLTSESDSLSTPSSSDFLATPASDDSQFAWEQVSLDEDSASKDQSDRNLKLIEASEDFQGDVLKKLRIAWAQ